ncbi:MAG TPA: hypothetical protein VGG77_07345 [Roseiarcus sp.]
MSNSHTVGSQLQRSATFKLSHTAEGQVLKASLPGALSREDFGKVATSAFDLISKLTGHPCMSGRIKFVVDDPIMEEVIRVELGPAI